MLKIGKNKYLLFLIIVVVFFSCGIGHVHALEVKYPSIPLPGLTPPSPDCTSNCLALYVIYLFGFLVYLGAFLALISFVIGAVGLVASLDNAESSSNAKDRMKGAILGLLLVMASFVILKTINPIFTSPTLTPIAQPNLPTPPPQPGVYFYLQSGCAGDASVAYASSQDSLDSSLAGKIQSVKIINDGQKGLYYGVILHQKIGLENGGSCNKPIVNQGTDSQCTDVSNPADTFSADIFALNPDPGSSGDGVSFYSEPFTGDRGSRAGYLKIPNDKIDFSGTTYKASNLCFLYNGIKQTDAYKYKCTKSTCPGSRDFSCTNDNMKNCGAGDVCVNGHCAPSNNSASYCSDYACETFQDCPGSIDIGGGYLVALYSSEGSGIVCDDTSNCPAGETCDQNSDTCINSELYCLTFTKSPKNLNAWPLTAESDTFNLGNIYIFPTK